MPATVVIIDPTPPWGMLEALTMTLGRQIQYLIGSPMTRVVANFEPTHANLSVESTLGFPDSGTLWIESRLYHYATKTDNQFETITTADGLERVVTIGETAEVIVYLPSVPAA